MLLDDDFNLDKPIPSMSLRSCDTGSPVVVVFGVVAPEPGLEFAAEFVDDLACRFAAFSTKE